MRNFRRYQLFKLKMKLTGSKKSSDCKMTALEKAFSNLKNNKSRDYSGYINEIFKPDVIGEVLKNSLLLMFNKLKAKKMIPRFIMLLI